LVADNDVALKQYQARQLRFIRRKVAQGIVKQMSLPKHEHILLLRWSFEAVPVVRLVLVADVLLAKIRNGDRDGAAEQGPQTADTDKGGDDAPVDIEVGRLTGLNGTSEALADECIVAAIPHRIMHRVLDLS